MDLSKYLDQVRIPTPAAKIYKEECCVSFDSATSDGGLYIDLNSFNAFGKDFVVFNYAKNRQEIYLNIRKTPKESDEEIQEPSAKKPTRLAIGTEDGFAGGDNIEYDEKTSIVVLPDFVEMPYPDVQLPEKVKMAVDAILAAEGAERAEQVAAWEAEEERKPSKFAAEDMLQLDGPKVGPSGWKCAHCDLTSNLWLNLTDGEIGCGRKFFDGTGGNNHAVDHAINTGYPLAVKLGTISADIAKADVYSYDKSEDDMVLDPFLEKHLAHWGIDFSKMEKTDKSMAELELDANVALDLSRLTDAGKTLEPLFGPGYTGFKNLGNTCYIASVMQAMFNSHVFQGRYYASQTLEDVFMRSPSDPSTHLPTQIAKLAHGVLSGRYSTRPPPAKEGEQVQQRGVPPRIFKNLVGAGHPEFSTSRQQDAMEFYQYLLQQLERSEHAEGIGLDITKHFKFAVEEKLVCKQSNKVRYYLRADNTLSLPIPLDKATNAAEVAASKVAVDAAAKAGGSEKVEAVRPVVPLQACLDAFAADEAVPDFMSPATGSNGLAIKSAHLATFPDYMVVHMRRFTCEDGGWVPKKLDVDVQVPNELDLTSLRGNGLQEGEEALPEDTGGGAGGGGGGGDRPAADPGVVAQLESMGFERARCEAAAVETGNAGVEAAMELLIAKMDDPTFGAAPPAPAAGGSSSSAGAPSAASEDDIAMLMSMGFERPAVVKALKATDNNLERAADWIFSHAGDIDTMDVDAPAASAGGGGGGGGGAGTADLKSTMKDGGGRYGLIGFVSHMGTSTSCGHYVAHLLKDGQWVLFNDEKVAKCETVPKELGYLYFFRRLDGQ